MVEKIVNTEALRKEIDFYKRQCDKTTSANLKLDFTISRLKHELEQKRKGFSLLSDLQQSVGVHKDISAIFDIAIHTINVSLGMDRTLVLTLTNEENCYQPSQWAGFQEETYQRFSTLCFNFPPDFAKGFDPLIATKATASTPLIENLRSELNLPYFVCLPVLVDEAPVGLLLTGRLKEIEPFYPPLDQGDIDTLQAIAGLISASVRNLRLAVFKEMDRLKSEFFANISHEFRTPITLTLGPLEQVLGGLYGEISEGVRQQVHVIQRNQERLMGLVNQILDLTKLEARSMRLKVSRIARMNRFIEERVAHFASMAKDRGIELKFELDPRVGEVDLYIDQEKFEKLLFNLLSNALKFTKSGWVQISTRIETDAFHLVVTDTGIGIKQDQLPHIFDRFRQADGSESREYAGTGIGLALVKQIAELHGGNITARSQYGTGSSFHVSIPLGKAHLDADFVEEAPADDASNFSNLQKAIFLEERPVDRNDIERSNQEVEAAFDREKSTILYVEDNQELRNHIRDLLASEYNVFLAEDGRDGLEKAKHYLPDLIITDQMMPHMSGKDLLEEVRADQALQSIPVIFLTARAGTEARIESLSAGADDYLAKPFNKGELLARVKNLLRVYAQERELAELNRRLEAKVEEQMAELLRSGDLRRFLPQSLVESLLAGQIELEEYFDRRKVTALFADIVSFTTLTDRLEPEEIALLINEYLSEMTASAVAHGGTIEKFIGDAVAVIFGAPQRCEVETQVLSALKTAFAMQAGVEKLSALAHRQGLPGDVTLRIGINTGYCTVGVFGSDLLKNYAALGNPVNIAARLQSEASPGTILCGFPSYAAVKNRVRAKVRGEFQLKGISHPVEAFEILEFLE